MPKYQQNKTAATYGLYVDTTRDNGYISFRASVVWIGLRPSEMARIDRGDADDRITAVPSDRITNVGGWEDGDSLINGVYLDHLMITSQGDDQRDRTEHRLYGFDVDYRNLFSVDRSTAEKMALTLTKIEKRMQALYDKYGNPETFGAYLLRVADAIGATRIVCERKQSGESSYGRRDNRIMELASGAQFVDGMIREWQQSFVTV